MVFGSVVLLSEGLRGEAGRDEDNFLDDFMREFSVGPRESGGDRGPNRGSSPPLCPQPLERLNLSLGFTIGRLCEKMCISALF